MLGGFGLRFLLSNSSLSHVQANSVGVTLALPGEPPVDAAKTAENRVFEPDE